MTTKLEQTLIDMADAGQYHKFNKIVEGYPDAKLDNMSQDNRSLILEDLSSDIITYLFNGDTVNVGKATEALRTFMSRFGESTEALTVEDPLINMIVNIDNYNAADYSAIDAITDYMSAQARAELSSEAETIIVQSISNNIIDSFLPDNAALRDSSTLALRDFMEKFGSTMSADTVNYSLELLAINLEQFHSGDYSSIDAITDNLNNEARADLPDLTHTIVINSIAENIYFGSLIDSDLKGQSEAGLRDYMTKMGEYVTETTVNDAVQDLLAVDSYVGLSAILGFVTDATAEALVALNQESFAERHIQVLGSGHDTLTTGKDADIVFARDGDDVVHLSAGADQAFGGLGNDTLYGEGGDDLLYGEEGDDHLYGGKGDDVLIGGTGADQLYGGGGADTFVLSDNTTGMDAITDFNSQQDILDFSVLLDGFDPLTDSITDFILQTEIDGKLVLSVDADGTGAGAAVNTLTLEGIGQLDLSALYNQGHILT